MDDYYLLDSDDDRLYRIYNKNKGERVIPKRALSEETMSMIDGLPKYKPEDPTESIGKSNIPDVPQELLSTPVSMEDKIEMEKSYERNRVRPIWSGPEGKPTRVSQIEGLLKDEGRYPEGSQQRKMLEDELVSKYEVNPSELSYKQAPEAIQQPQQPVTTQKEEQPQYVDDTKTLNVPDQGVRYISNKPAEQKILNDDYSVDSSLARIKKETLSSMEEIQRSIALRDLEQDKLEKDYNAQKINPNLYWQGANGKTDWGRKIGMSIAVGLSGFGSAITGTENTALKLLMKQVDDNIEAQKANLDKKKNALSMYMEKSKSMQEAEYRLRSDYYKLIEASIKQKEYRMQNAQDALRLQLLAQQVRGEKQKYDAADIENAFRKATATGQAVNDDMINSLGKEWDNRKVRMPDNSMAVSWTPEGKKAVDDANTARNNLMRISSEMSKIMAGGRVGFFDERNPLVDDLITQGIFSIKSLENLGALSVDESKKATAMFPDMKALRQGPQFHVLRQLNDYIQSKTQGFYDANLMGTGFKQAKRPQSAQPGIAR